MNGDGKWVLLTLFLGVLLAYQGLKVLSILTAAPPTVPIPPAEAPPSLIESPSVLRAENPGQEDFQAVYEKNLFNPDRRPVTLKATPTPAPRPVQRGLPTQTEPIFLYGVIMDGDYPTALVRAGQKGEIRSVKPGDEILDGVTVQKIDLDGIVILENGEERIIEVEGRSGPGTPVPTPRPTPQVRRLTRPRDRQVIPPTTPSRFPTRLPGSGITPPGR